MQFTNDLRCQVTQRYHIIDHSLNLITHRMSNVMDKPKVKQTLLEDSDSYNKEKWKAINGKHYCKQGNQSK